MKSTLVSKNVTIRGKRTSLRLEEEMWEALREVCRRENVSIHDLCSMVEDRRGRSSRTSAVRAFVITYFRVAAKTGDGAQVVMPGLFPKNGDGKVT